MEAELGLQLFVRMNGRLTPTPEANLVAHEMSQVIDSYERMRSVADSIRDTGSGLLRIATLTFSHVFLPETIRQFQQLAPGAKISIHVLRTTEIIDMVQNGGADIGIVTNSDGSQILRHKDLRGMNVIAAVHPDSDLTRKEFITPSDLHGERLLSYSPESPFGELASLAFSSVGERFEVNLQVASSTLLCALVEQGVGVALLEPFILLGPLRYKVVARPFEPQILMKPRILFSANRPLSKLAQIFIQLLEAHANQLVRKVVR